MNAIKKFFQKILSSLSIRPVVGGLEVSDQVLRLAYFNSGTWQMVAIRLAPGVIGKGKINDLPTFINALHELKLKVPFAKKKKNKMNVVVSLSSVNIYSQVFTLPLMEGKDLENAVDLNVRMLSPMDIAQTYFGWEIIGRDEASFRSEVSAAFVDKALVDDVTQALYSAGFVTVGVESRALALVRIFREKGMGADVNKSYLLLSIDNSGIDFLVIRKGRLYFEYSTQWADLSDEKGQVLMEKFQETLAANARQVMNFYTQHWPEPLVAIILSATALEKEAEQVIQTAISLPVIRLTLVMDQPVSSEWLVALGCSLRGIDINLTDKEINLSGAEAMGIFHREQLFDFVVLWRVLVPAVFAALILMFSLADNFLGVTESGVTSNPAFQQQEMAEMQALEASSTIFSRSVALVAAAEARLNGNYLAIGKIKTIATANNITISHISFTSPGVPMLVAGSALSESQVLAFKDAVQNDPHFGGVDLPISNIQSNGGSYTFSMTFPLSPSGF